MKVAIIGAGPAGMFCASKLENCQVSVYEKNAKVGVKLNITGKGRCNITNDCNCEEFLEKVTKGMTREDVILTVGAPQKKVFTTMPVGEFSSQTMPVVCHYYYTSDGKEIQLCYSFSDDMTVETVMYVLCY